MEQTFENKSITKEHRIQNKWTDYKIFELKFENNKLLNVWKYNQVRLVLADFASVIYIKLLLNYIKQEISK